MVRTGNLSFIGLPTATSNWMSGWNGESLWLSQKQMALLFGKDPDTIGLHLRKIYKEKELSVRATTAGLLGSSK